MDNSRQLQRLTSSNVPSVATAEALASIRMDERRYPRYGKLAQPSRLEWLAQEVKTLGVLARTRDMDGREVLIIASSLDEMLTETPAMADLTLPELHDAFKSGVFGLFGDYYGLSAPSLYGFVNGYLDSAKKVEASKIIRKTRIEEQEERNRAEREAEQRKIREEIEQAKRDGTFIPTGNAWFQPKKVKDAVDSSEHREKIRRQAEEIREQARREGRL